MWYVYMIRLDDNSIYTGITKDLERRMEEHENGKGSKYVRSRLPLKLVYSEEHENKSSALKREAGIKKWSKRRKERFVSAKSS
ncbi:MAG: GIY-YIG nuclease family protein [Candidatus Aenigmatarchaeota archaeon]